MRQEKIKSRRCLVWQTGCSFLIVLFFFSSCAYKSSYFEDKKQLFYYSVPLFIEIPENSLVFENVSGLIYKSLYNYFRNVGYHLVDSNKDACSLKIKVKKVDPIDKLISPDVLTYASRIEVELLCVAIDKHGNQICKEKGFFASTLVSKSKNSKLNASFFDFELTKLLERRMAPRIEQHFRSFWR
jgi:hypothetical protein